MFTSKNNFFKHAFKTGLAFKQNPSKNGLWISVYVNPAIEKFNYSEYKSFLEKKFDL